ncbi:MAG: DUF4097 family beta strand repeat-containing protein [Terriglobales bacterium]
MMRKLWAGTVAAVVVAIAVAPAWAAQWQRSYPVTGPAVLRLDTSVGGVVINGGSQGQVQVQVQARGWTIGPGGVRIVAHQEGNTVTVEIHAPQHTWGWADHDLHVTVAVPRQTRLHIHTGDGDLRVTGVDGTAWLRTGDGDIVGRDLRAPDLVARTGDGNIRVSGRLAAVEAGTGDGDIHLDAEAGSRVNNAWMLRSGDGNLTVTVPEGLAADLDARTGDGSIRVNAPIAMNGTMSSNHVSGQIHGGGGLIALRSGDGTITVRTN